MNDYNLLNWDAPDPRNALYWAAIRDALTSRRIQTNEAYPSDATTIQADGFYFPQRHCIDFAKSVLAALRGASALWDVNFREENYAEYPFFNEYGDPVLDEEDQPTMYEFILGQFPSRGWPANDGFFVDFLRLAHEIILKYRSRKEPIWYGPGWGGNTPYYGGIPADTPNAAIALNAAEWGESSGVTQIFYAHFFGSNRVDEWNIPGRIWVNNPLPVGGVFKVVATNSNPDSEYPESCAYDAFGTGIVEGENEFSIGTGMKIIAEQSESRRLLDNNYFDYPNIEERGFMLPEYVSIDYGEHFILPTYDDE